MLRSIGSILFVTAGLAVIVGAAHCFDAGLPGSNWKHSAYQSAVERSLDAMLPAYSIESVSFCPESDASSGASLFLQVSVDGDSRVYQAFVPFDTMIARCSLYRGQMPIYDQDDRP